MREVGIQYSAPMVRGVLDDSKNVTRRTVKGEIPAGAVRAVFGQWSPGRPHAWRWLDQSGAPLGKPFRCPYGVAGDRLWVREAWRTLPRLDELPPRDVPPGSPVTFYADGGDEAASLGGKFRPGMFMPRWASRIVLEVTDVRVERLQAISEDDARSEGVAYDPGEGGFFWVPGLGCASDRAVDSFRLLWQQINGEDSWNENPFVFAISFRRITP